MGIIRICNYFQDDEINMAGDYQVEVFQYGEQEDASPHLNGGDKDTSNRIPNPHDNFYLSSIK